MTVATPAYAGLACDVCHTMPPSDSAAGDRQPATGAFKGNHQGHSSSSIDSCIPCHGTDVSSYNAAHSAVPAGSGARSVIRLTPALNNYSIGHARAAYSRGTFFNQTSIPPNPLGTCSNVNCHFEKVTPAWGTANFVAPTDCDKCHGAPPSGAAAGAAGSHAKHDSYYPGAANCLKCHPNNANFQHATSAGNRNLNVNFNAAPNNGSGSYTGPLNDFLPSQTNVFGNCNATYCHGTTMSVAGDKNGGTNITPTWGTASTGQCGTCHGKDSTNPPLRGSHRTHAGTAEWYHPPSGLNDKIIGRGIACNKCHKTGGGNHVNGSAEWSFNSISSPWLSGARYRGLSSGSVSGVPSSSYGTCTNLYCHSIVQTTTGGPLTGLAGEYKTVTWGNMDEGTCGSCHDVDLGHATWAGRGGAAEISSASHTKHLKALGVSAGIGATPGGPARCAVCHNYGNTDSLLGCAATCHNGQGIHVDHKVDIKFTPALYGASAAYTGTPAPGDGFGGCTSTYCHSNGLASSPTYYTPTWGNTASGACGTCHGANAAAPPASTPHNKHLSSANPYLIACAACHSGKVQATASSTIQPAYANQTSHVNKVRDVKFNSASPYGTYSSANLSCRNLYCHSIGNLNVTTGALPAAYNGKLYARQTWSGTLSCNGCHGRSTSNGMPDYTNGGAATATANSHPKHVTNNTIGCVQCHEKTTKTGTTIRSTVPSKHVNSTTNDVFFNLSSKNASGTYNATRKRCYNSYCHSDGSKASGPFVPYSSAAWGASLTCAGCHKADIASGSPFTTNSHSGHINKFGGQYSTLRCVKCHAVTAKADMTIAPGSRHTNSQLEIAFDSSSSATNGTYIGTLATPASPMVKDPGSAKGTCANIYCHSSGQGAGGSWPPTYYTTPAWGTSDMQFCGKCHGFPFVHGGSFGTSTPLTTGSHVKHLQYEMNVTYRGYERCVTCHAYKRTGFDPLSCNATLCHGAGYLKHSNYEINVGIPVFYGASAAFNGTTKPGHNGVGYANSTCSLVYCHSNGLAVSPTYVTPRWGDTASGACGTCHGAKADSPPASTAHNKHAGSSNPYSYACGLCHAGIVKQSLNSTTYAVISTATTIGAFDGSKLHVNKTRNVKFNASNPSAVYTTATQTCSTAYCHSIGKTGGTLPATPVATAYGAYSASFPYSKIKWTGTSNCRSCHGRTGAVAGMPDYDNAGAGVQYANSHLKHVVNSVLACVECHEKTTKTGMTIRNSFPSKHVNGSGNDVFFNLSGNNTSGVYTSGTKTCATVACHSNGRGTYRSAQWGVASNCDYCHPIASLGGSHAKHVDLSQMPAFYSYTANNSTTNTHNFGCSNCHPLIGTQHARGAIVLDLRPITGSSLLRSKNKATITASGPVNTANSGTSGATGTNVVCLNVYCHSNGYSANTVFATTPNWYGGTFSGDRCAACHGNSPNSTIAGSPAHYNADFAGPGNAGGHVVGIHYDNIQNAVSGLATPGELGTSSHGNPTTSTSLNCDNCHFTTVESRNNDKNTACVSCHNGANLRGDAVIANRMTHVNGQPDVVFDAIQVRSKAQLNAQSNYTTAFIRVGGYKTSGAYDIAKTTLDTATMWNSSTKTCSNVSCHFNKPISWSNTGTAYKCLICHDTM